MTSEFKNSFWICSAGAVAVMTALVIPLLLGFASLGVEVGHWYLGQRTMQGAADAAAVSAAAQWIADKGTGTTYQTVGVNYASYNGFTIPTANVCLVPQSGSDNCATVRSLDARAIVCSAPPCIVVEISENTANWLSTKASLEPGVGKLVKSIPAPTLVARATVSLYQGTKTVTKAGTDCVLALANATNAVQVRGNGDPTADCGIAIDGGRDQNVSGAPLGGITFSGANAQVNIGDPTVNPTPLVVASNSTNCPGSHCFWQNPSTTVLPASAIKTNTATADPYASQVATLFATSPPEGVKTGGVVIVNPGSGYTAPCTFTIKSGTYYTATSSPAKFTATILNGKVTAIVAVTDPGAYAALPNNPVTVNGCGGSGATFTLTEGCFTWNGTAIAGRKYCSINLNGAGKTNFPAGSYYIAGGDSGCVGFCVSSNNATVTSDVAGVTFLLTNGEGIGTFGSTSYAYVNITSGTISLCAPGTNCGTTCTNAAGPTSCMLFIQNPAAPTTTLLNSNGIPSPANTLNAFSGNGTRTLSGLIYLPRQTFSESGNGPILGCVGVIAKYLDIAGTPTFSDGCLPGNGIGGGTTTISVFSPPYLYQ